MDKENVRSPSKIDHHVSVVIHCNRSSAIMTVIRANGGKVVSRSVRKIFILYTYIDSSAFLLRNQGDPCIINRTHIHLCPHCLWLGIDHSIPLETILRILYWICLM